MLHRSQFAPKGHNFHIKSSVTIFIHAMLEFVSVVLGCFLSDFMAYLFLYTGSARKKLIYDFKKILQGTKEQLVIEMQCKANEIGHAQHLI